MSNEPQPGEGEQAWGSAVPPQNPAPGSAVPNRQTGNQAPVPAPPPAAHSQGAGAAGEAGNQVRRAANFAPPAKNVKEFFRDWWATTKEIATAPNEFYQKMPRGGGFAEPSYFMVVNAAGGALIQNIIGLNLLAVVGQTALSMLSVLLLARAIVYMLGRVGGALEFEETYRVMAFGSVPMLLMGLPWIWQVGLLWMAVLWFLGLKKLSRQ